MGNSSLANSNGCCKNDCRADSLGRVQLVDPLSNSPRDSKPPKVQPSPSDQQSGQRSSHQEQPKFCTSCAAAVQPGTKSCPSCGAQLVAEAAGAAEVHVFANGVKYVGQWSNSGTLRAGHGVQYWLDGSKYDGQWEDDKAHGDGRFENTDGSQYQGQWRQDQAHGEGTYLHSDGAKYAGQWSEDQKHGRGEERYPCGTTYTGQFMCGLKHGRGRFSKSDGSVYEGEFSEDCIHGSGRYEWGDGRTYDGQYSWNCMHGQGKFVGTSGHFYEGMWRDDLKDGTGTFAWPDGSRYIGQWSKNKQHGNGTMVKPSGDRRHGKWECGQLLEPGYYIVGEEEAGSAEEAIDGAPMLTMQPLQEPTLCGVASQNSDERPSDPPDNRREIEFDKVAETPRGDAPPNTCPTPRAA